MNNTNWIDRQEYAFDSHFYQVPAGRLHYVDEGSGPPVVMVHGNPTWSYLYRHLIKQLQPEHRCIAMDHIGFGLSDQPRDWSYLPSDHAANLTALINGLGLKDIAFREKELKRWESAFPAARTVRLSSVGHFVQEEAPDELAAAVVPFLQESSAPARVSPQVPVRP